MTSIKLLASAGLATIALGGGLLFAAPASAQPLPKVTICHYTASETNPVVEITISGNARGKHEENHHGVTSPHQGQDRVRNLLVDLATDCPPVIDPDEEE